MSPFNIVLEFKKTEFKLKYFWNNFQINSNVKCQKWIRECSIQWISAWFFRTCVPFYLSLHSILFIIEYAFGAFHIAIVNNVESNGPTNKTNKWSNDWVAARLAYVLRIYGHYARVCGWSTPQSNSNRTTPIHCVYAFVIFSYVCSLRTHQPSFNMLKKVFLDGHFDRKNFFLWNNKVESKFNLCCNRKSRFPLKQKVNILLGKLIENKIDANSGSENGINWCVKVFVKWKENA